MKLAAIALVFCAVAFGQSAPSQHPLLDGLKPAEPSDLFQGRVLSMDLLHAPPKFAAIGPKVLLASPAPRVCAIPLLQALPANGKTDYKIRIYTPPAPEPQTALNNQAGAGIGIPACK
jgi:hypothetical protein